MNAAETSRWRETWPDGSRRTYRRVSLYDPASQRTNVFEEILMPDGSWRKRGSESVKRGMRLELVSRAYTASGVELAAERGEKWVPLGVQNASGHGFDEVVFKFDRDANGRMRARVGIVEVKDYPGRYVPSADFTAIDRNMRQNLLEVERKMNQLGPEGLGMTEGEFRQARQALIDRKLDVEIRIGHETRLGIGPNAATIPGLEADLRARYGKEVKVNRTPVRLSIGLDEATLALERLQARAGNERFAQLALTPSGMTPRSILIADTVLKGERLGAVERPCEWAASRGYLHDKAGTPVLVEPLVRGGGKSFDPAATAERLLTLLDERRLPRTGTSEVPVKVLVDASALTPGQRVKLMTELDTRARTRSRTAAVKDRLAWVGR